MLFTSPSPRALENGLCSSSWSSLLQAISSNTQYWWGVLLTPPDPIGPREKMPLKYPLLSVGAPTPGMTSGVPLPVFCTKCIIFYGLSMEDKDSVSFIIVSHL